MYYHRIKLEGKQKDTKTCRTDCVPAKIQTRHILNRNQKNYCFSHLGIKVESYTYEILHTTNLCNVENPRDDVNIVMTRLC